MGTWSPVERGSTWFLRARLDWLTQGVGNRARSASRRVQLLRSGAHPRKVQNHKRGTGACGCSAWRGDEASSAGILLSGSERIDKPLCVWAAVACHLQRTEAAGAGRLRAGPPGPGVPRMSLPLVGGLQGTWPPRPRGRLRGGERQGRPRTLGPCHRGTHG